MHALALCSLLACFPVSARDEALFHFSHSAASSTNEGGSSRDFDADRALQPGSGYWCSQGHHADDETITWIGYFKHPVQLLGLRVRWAYSPREVEVSGTTDSGATRVLRPWRSTASDERGCVQVAGRGDRII
eukprot:Polyplicarium_translucidae@DN3339_c3_g1_i1.p1